MTSWEELGGESDLGASTRRGQREHMDEKGRATLFKFGFVHLKSTISLSQSIFNIMHFQRTQFSLSLRWRVESNLKMRVGLECCLHKRARKWGGASMGSRSRNFYSDSDLNFLKSIIYIMASNACMLNTIPAFVQVTIGKVTASLECSLHTRAMCKKCTVPWMRGCKMSMNLIGGSNMQTKAIWIAEDESKVGGEMPS